MFTNKFSELVSVVQHCVRQLSDECLAKGLLSQDNYSIILYKDQVPADKARILLTNISTNIIRDHQKFKEFLDLLEVASSCNKELVTDFRKELAAATKDLQAQAQLKTRPNRSYQLAFIFWISVALLACAWCASWYVNQECHTDPEYKGQPYSRSPGMNQEDYTDPADNSQLTGPQVGPAVVEECIEKLRSPIFGMLDDNDFMRRVAHVMSDCGRNMKEGGGIWQLSLTAFEDTKDTRAHYSLPNKYQRIWEAYGIDWTTVKYDDLKMPFYSALAARLYLSNFSKHIPPSHQVSEQAEYWKFQYMRGRGDMKMFRDKVLELQNTTK